MNLTGPEIIERIKEIIPTVLKLRNRKEIKDDGSYVTEGDLLLSRHLKQIFEDNLPYHTFISEEDYDQTMDYDPEGSYIFVDPIDGTENFVSGLKEWGIGISIYTNGQHYFSLIYLPEMFDYHFTGMEFECYESRVVGLSSSIKVSDLDPSKTDLEVRITGCAMYNLLSAARGCFRSFENVKGVNCWDILPGLNLALENHCLVEVDEKKYCGEILFPTRKYKVKISNGI